MLAMPEDLSDLEVLDENSILQALRNRFYNDNFYTYIGEILLAVNPCRPLASFEEKVHIEYENVVNRKQRPPHLFWTANFAYGSLVETGRNQCILVSGESGAGKTESTKYMIRHLMRVSPSQDKSLLHKIVQVNPLLEAFGNAATTMNTNSSRFGKFVELHYSDNNQLLGAKIDDYILEKSRVVHRNKGEQNFHVFYALFAGMPRDRLLYYFLEDPDCHRIMRDEDPGNGVFRDSEEFQLYKKMFSDLTVIMSEIGFCEEHISVIFLILASILHLANIVFMPCEETDGVTVVDEYPLHAVAKLLGIEDEVELTEALISNVNFIKGERIQSWRNLREANDNRDALAKDLYSRLFGWIVGQVNRNLWQNRVQNISQRSSTIGLLDMSGFENFAKNSFDQFLINISNEKLQQYFMDYIFPRERREYELEAVEWRDIIYHSNDEVLDLLFRRPDGVLSLLDEESLFPQSNDFTFVHKLDQYCKDNSRYICSVGRNGAFGIRHYAESVEYDSDGFLERNRDNLSQDLVHCLLNSSNDFIKDLFTASMSPTGTISDYASRCSSRPKLPCAWPSTIEPECLRESLSRQASLKIKRSRGLSGDSIASSVGGRNSPTVTKHFKRSLSDLMTKLSQAQPLFVRCIKPNQALSPTNFDPDLVQRQLLCNGLMEIAELRRDGYPVRIKYEDFVKKYEEIFDFSLGHLDSLGLTNEILKSCNIDGYNFGRTKVFLKHRHKDVLDEHLRKKHMEKELCRIKEEKSKSLISGGNAMSLLTVPNQLSTQRNSADSGLDLHVRGLDDLGNRGAADNDGSIATTPPFDAASSFLDKMDAEESTFPVKNRPSDLIGTETTTTSENLDEDVDQWRPYDIFQVSEREFEDNDYIFKEILKGIRLFLYFFIVVAVLACVMASKLSLLLLTSGINKDENSRGQHLVMILFCLCAPIAWNWFMALMKTLFGGKEWPSMLTFFVLMLLECSETLGICLMLFRVLPSTDFFRGLVTTMAICQIPSLLKVVVHEKRPNLSIAEIVTIIMNVLAFLVQGASIPFFNIVDFIKEGNYTILEGHNETSYFEAHVIVSNKLEWELPLALILISLGYWENYVSGEWCIFGKLTIPFKKWRSILQDVRETSYVLVAPFKIGLAVLLSRLLTGNTDFVFPATENFNASTSRFQSRAQEVGVSYSLVFIQIGTGVICTYLAGLACKLHMQRTAFAFPLIMGPPAALIFVYFQCEYQFLPAQWHVGGWFCANQNLQNMLIPMICAFLLWLSYAITVSHIWFPQSERMAKIEKLFVTPHFNAVFPDFTLTLRRRRNDKEVKLTGFDTFRYVGDDVYGSEDLYNSGKNVTPKVYVCATMWHETKQEMTQLLKSLFRLDYVHCASRLAQEKFKIQDPDYFDLEMHVIFDDAFELDEKVDKFVPNMFVKQLIECMEDAARSVVKGPICISPPERVPTPYGGRLIWTMPGHTKMVVHIKNKNKIRHRKRWSQVMYLYYLLGYRLLGVKESEKIIMEEGESTISKVRNRKKGKKALRSRPLKRLFTRMDPEQYEQAESTFILTLDGDVDFRPDSVKLLIDRMKKNRKVGAVCGRIHPIGSGPMVWYQQFEYAVGHWLQKAAEHVFGCVLCCPGCFSLFRGSAIMDDNVLKMYTTKPTEARHYIQFEQGEDRWLCTLLLQQGHKIDYCAGADALTFAPETFNEFFNQRRRWSPSTLANMMDLLSSWRDTTRINDNISRPYILYQFVLMASTILAPSTVILMITGSYHSVLKLGIWESYILSLLPVLIYLGICMYFKSDTQIMAAAVLTALYSIVMMIATVGTIVSIVTENFGSPNVVFLTGLVAIFTLAGIIHPQEFFCLVYGALYFMVVPSTFILLTVYYLCNLNNVSWGTRETPKKLTKEEEEELKRQQEEKKKKKESKSIFNKLGITNLINEVRDLIRGIIGTKIEKAVSEVAVQTETSDEFERKLSKLSRHSELSRPSVVRPEMIIDEVTPTGWEADPDNPYWLSLEYLGKGDIKYISGEEEIFWQFMIKKYLHPLDEDQQHKEKIKKDLESLKNNVVFIYFMINFLWTVITLQLQSMEDELKNFYIINKYEPLSLIFLSVFAIAISLQFFSMFVHRWGTFLHLMSSTRIDWFKKVHTEEDFVRFVVNEAQRLQRLEPEPDYDDLPPDYDDDYIVSPGSEQYDELPSLPQSPNGTARMHRKSNKRTFASDTHEIPLLQQIFEDRLENMHRQWRQGTLAFRPPNNMRSLGIDRHDSKRFSERENQMRQKMFKRSFKKKSSEEESNEKKDNDAVKIDILNL